MDVVKHLRYFLAVVDEGSFSRAAVALGMAQPPLSQRIKALEAHLGVDLFDRSKRQIALTDQGEMLVPEARAILRQVNNLPSHLADPSADGAAIQVRLPSLMGPEAAGRIAANLAALLAQRVVPRLDAERATEEDRGTALVPGRFPGGHPVSAPLGLAVAQTHSLAQIAFPLHGTDFAEGSVVVLADDASEEPQIRSVLLAVGIATNRIQAGVDAGTGVALVHSDGRILVTDEQHAARHRLRWYPILEGATRWWTAVGPHGAELADVARSEFA